MSHCTDHHHWNGRHVVHAGLASLQHGCLPPQTCVHLHCFAFGDQQQVQLARQDHETVAWGLSLAEGGPWEQLSGAVLLSACATLQASFLLWLTCLRPCRTDSLWSLHPEDSERRQYIYIHMVRAPHLPKNRQCQICGHGAFIRGRTWFRWQYQSRRGLSRPGPPACSPRVSYSLAGLMASALCYQ